MYMTVHCVNSAGAHDKSVPAALYIFTEYAHMLLLSRRSNGHSNESETCRAIHVPLRSDNAQPSVTSR